MKVQCLGNEECNDRCPHKHLHKKTEDLDCKISVSCPRCKSIEGEFMKKNDDFRSGAIKDAQIKAGEETYIPTWLRTNPSVSTVTSYSDNSSRTSKKQKAKKTRTD